MIPFVPSCIKIENYFVKQNFFVYFAEYYGMMESVDNS